MAPRKLFGHGKEDILRERPEERDSGAADPHLTELTVDKVKRGDVPDGFVWFIDGMTVGDSFRYVWEHSASQRVGWDALTEGNLLRSCPDLRLYTSMLYALRKAETDERNDNQRNITQLGGLMYRDVGLGAYLSTSLHATGPISSRVEHRCISHKQYELDVPLPRGRISVSELDPTLCEALFGMDAQKVNAAFEWRFPRDPVVHIPDNGFDMYGARMSIKVGERVFIDFSKKGGVYRPVS